VAASKAARFSTEHKGDQCKGNKEEREGCSILLINGSDHWLESWVFWAASIEDGINHDVDN